MGWRRTCGLVACCLVACALLGPVPVANAGMIFHVDSTDDPGVSSGVTDCPSPCDLRHAMTAANNVVGADTIDFELGASGVHTITIDNGLPGIISPVTIDGTTEDGWSVTSGPLVQISGSGQLAGTGLIVEEPTVMRGLIVNNFPDGGITTLGVPGHTGALTITGSYIGTNAAGTACMGNGATGANGISLNAASQNTIGGTGPGERNVIACNNGAGVFIAQGAELTTVQNSYVGLLANGFAGTGQATGVHNQSPRVRVQGGSVISGNTQDGILFDGGAERDSVDDNFIGTDPTGNVARPNGRYGVNFSGDSQGIHGNVIAGNVAAGIHVQPPSGDVTIAGNNLGRGLAPGGGIGVAGGGHNGSPVGNGGAGVEVGSGSASLMSLFNNVIANNAGDGVAVLWTGIGTAPLGVNFAQNFFDANGGLGIDLGDDGVTPNDPDPGPGANGGQNYPVLTSVTTGGGNTAVQGTLDSEPNKTYAITFYVSPSCDPSDYGEGASTSWPTSAPFATDGSGHATFTHMFAGEAPIGSYVTATANTFQMSDPGTSEFSQCIRVPGAPSATTEAPTDVGLAGATMNGSADPHGLASTAHFEYGLTTAYGSSTTEQALGAGFGQQAVSQSLGGLSSGTTFHYRLVATNSKGMSLGQDLTFTTTTPIVGGGPPPGPGGTLDTTAPNVRLLLLRQKLRRALARGYVLRFDDDEAGTAALDLFAEGRLAGALKPAAVKSVRVARGTKTVSTAGRRRIVAKFTRKAKRAFGRKRKVRLLIRLTATDAAGNKRVVRKHVTLKR